MHGRQLLESGFRRHGRKSVRVLNGPHAFQTGLLVNGHHQLGCVPGLPSAGKQSPAAFLPAAPASDRLPVTLERFPLDVVHYVYPACRK